jgi:hypothetical protein
VQTLQDRLLTSSDLRQFLEAVLAAACDRMQVTSAFVATLGNDGLEMLVTLPGKHLLGEGDSQGMLQAVAQNGHEKVFAWSNYWLVPLYGEVDDDHSVLGLLGVARGTDLALDTEQREALLRLAHRAVLALEDRLLQQKVFRTLEELNPQATMLERMRAAGRYGGAGLLSEPSALPIEHGDLFRWVKDALTHYWGGPRLTESPLLRLQVVQQTSNEHDSSPTNALRAILRTAIDRTRPEGERRFTGEWILYNILDMKFMEGHKVREIAMRLAMSEADLYRKQRVAIEAVANAILEMEQKAREENSS